MQKEERVRDPSLALSLSRSSNRVRGRRNLGVKSVRDLHASRSGPRHPDRLYGVLRIPCAQPSHNPNRHCLCHVGRSRHRLDRLGWLVLVPADAGRSGADWACPDRWRRCPCKRLLTIPPALSRSQLSMGFSISTVRVRSVLGSYASRCSSSSARPNSGAGTVGSAIRRRGGATNVCYGSLTDIQRVERSLSAMNGPSDLARLHIIGISPKHTLTDVHKGTRAGPSADLEGIKRGA